VKWDKAENRRAVFEEYALQKQFNPLNPENWYQQSRREIAQAPVC
jgi:hypothetical protein